jgi:hypothetical protein
MFSWLISYNKKMDFVSGIETEWDTPRILETPNGDR